MRRNPLILLRFLRSEFIDAGFEGDDGGRIAVYESPHFLALRIIIAVAEFAKIFNGVVEDDLEESDFVVVDIDYRCHFRFPFRLTLYAL